jgi:hypothetical protein
MQDNITSQHPSQSLTPTDNELICFTDELAKAYAVVEKQNGTIEKQNGIIEKLNGTIETQANHIATLLEAVQQLKDEIARLKGDNPKPKIPPSNLESRTAWKKKFHMYPIDMGKSIEHCFWTGNLASKHACRTIVSSFCSLPLNAFKITKCAIKIIRKIKFRGKRGQPRGKPRSRKRGEVTVHNNVYLNIPTEDLPQDAKFKGYRSYLVQDICLCTNNTMYYRAQYQLPNGNYIAAGLPSGIRGHYGPNTIAYILNQSNTCRVTEPLLLAQLRDIGVRISAGQISVILTKDLDNFHEEANELLPVGMKLLKKVQSDDTGGRHKGVNQYTTVIGNEYFSYFRTTKSKSRINFLQLLQGGRGEYLINEDTIAYLQEFKGIDFLQGYIGQHCGRQFKSTEEWQAFLTARNITQEREIRLVTEAALVANLLEHWIPRDLCIHSDDAGQFDLVILFHTLCWIHEERHYRKLVMTNESGRDDLKRVRSQIWSLYTALQAYKEAPSERARDAIEKRFDEIFLQETSSPTLNHRLQQTYGKKKKLLGVLERVDSFLHNNSSETDARSAKAKLKVSGGTRSDEGRDARDTFLSLKQTCLKLGINFLEYIKDRVQGLYKIPKLSTIIRQRVGSALAGRVEACMKAHRYFSALLCQAVKKVGVFIQRDIPPLGFIISRLVYSILGATAHGPPEQQEDNILFRDTLVSVLSG